jgi:hypothetical protein
MSWIGINTNEELSEFLGKTDYFSDTIIRECALVARGYVDHDHSMANFLDPYDAKVFLQTQFSDTPGIELEFEGVHRFGVKLPSNLAPRGALVDGRIEFSFIADQHDEPQIVADAMRYRLLDCGCLGCQRRLTTKTEVEE